MSKNLVINKLPSPTWYWLKMNDAAVCVPDTLSPYTPQRDGDVLRFNLREGENCFFENSIHAKEGEDLTVIMEYESVDNGQLKVESSKSDSYFSVKTNVFLEKGSHLHLVKIQTLANDFVHYDKTSAQIGEGAQFHFTQIELGAKKSFVELAANLNNEKSHLKSDISYYLAKNQELDMNFVANHLGKKTQSVMNAYGTLNDAAKKTFRGTIDFKNGCSASTGNEQEETLLLSENVENKSIPLILCAEEDVSGEHGASIGRLDESVLFYMNSRGIEKPQAQELMSRAKIMRVAAAIPNEESVKKVSEFLDKTFKTEDSNI